MVGCGDWGGQRTAMTAEHKLQRVKGVWDQATALEAEVQRRAEVWHAPTSAMSDALCSVLICSLAAWADYP